DLANHHVPLTDDRTKMASFVGRGLLRDLDRRLKSPEGFDEDYFIRAQDYLEDWPQNIVVSNVRTNSKTASALVTLGAIAESKQQLGLRLLTESGRWKISRVSQPITRKR